MAIDYLQTRGLTLVERNYQCRLGEIDLVMRDREQLVFVEVRFRRRREYGMPVETVSRSKRNKLILCARHYLHRRGQTNSISCRFDVLGIDGSADTGRRNFHWVRDAFGC